MSPEEHFEKARPGRLVLQDEGGPTVYLDVYASGERDRLARIEVRRWILGIYALDLLKASLRDASTPPP